MAEAPTLKRDGSGDLQQFAEGPRSCLSCASRGTMTKRCARRSGGVRGESSVRREESTYCRVIPFRTLSTDAPAMLMISGSESCWVSTRLRPALSGTAAVSESMKN
jgi:hypothetical protein